jgi:hypothetical protein
LPEGVTNHFDERSLQSGMNFTLEAEDESLDLLGEMSTIGDLKEPGPRAARTG